MLPRPPPRPHPHRLRRSPPGGQCRADPSCHPGPAPGPARTGPQPSRPRPRPGPGEHGRQDDDPGCVRAGWWRVHRRRRRVAHRQDGPHPGRHGQGAIHPGDLPAQLQLGPRPPAGSGEPRVAVPSLGRWCWTRRRAVDHRSGLHHLRDLLTNHSRYAAIGARGGA